jgi:hypothetical protein
MVVPESLPRYLAGDIYGFNEIVHKFPNLFCHFLHFQYTYCGFHNQLVLPIFSERSGGQPAFKYQQCSIKAVRYRVSREYLAAAAAAAQTAPQSVVRPSNGYILMDENPHPSIHGWHASAWTLTVRYKEHSAGLADEST